MRRRGEDGGRVDGRWYPWRPKREPMSWFMGCALVITVVPFGLIVAGIAVSLLGPAALWLLLGLAVAGSVLGHLWALWSAPVRGYRTSPEGLALHRHGGLVELVGWREIHDVRVEGQRATIVTTRGEWPVTPEIRDWRGLVREVMAGMEAARPEGAPKNQIPPQDVAEWLGIEPDEVLVCRRPGLRLVQLIWPLLMTVLVSGAALSSGDLADAFSLLAVMVGLWAPFYFGINLSLWREALRREVVAGTWGLRYREGRRWVTVDWADLLDIRSAPRENRQSLFYLTTEHMLADTEWLVSADGAEFRFPPSARHSSRLVRAIQRAVAARRDGQLLPRMTDVPDTAVSRAEVRTAADRGLSSAGEGEA